jgi:hypothetical protein
MGIVHIHLRKMPLKAWFHLKVGRCGYRVADTMVRRVSTKMVGIIFNLGTSTYLRNLQRN